MKFFAHEHIVVALKKKKKKKKEKKERKERTRTGKELLGY
jgi:hypothetical protein